MQSCLTLSCGHPSEHGVVNQHVSNFLLNLTAGMLQVAKTPVPACFTCLNQEMLCTHMQSHMRPVLQRKLPGLFWRKDFVVPPIDTAQASLRSHQTSQCEKGKPCCKRSLSKPFTQTVICEAVYSKDIDIVRHLLC